VSEERKSNNLKYNVKIFFTAYQYSKVVVYLRLKLHLFDRKFLILNPKYYTATLTTLKESSRQLNSRKLSE